MMLRFIALMLTTFKSCGLVEGPFKDESLVGFIASASGEQRLGVILARSNHALSVGVLFHNVVVISYN
jgi:hypothetical protein